MLINNSRTILREWKQLKEKASLPKYKYNPSFVQKVEERTDTVAADYREGSDTGNEPQRHNFNN